jgi:hypothetical protein
MEEDVAIAQGFGRWSEAGLPHRGWVCVDHDDLREPCHICEMCQHAKCRYVYLMKHPAWPEALWVGCDCAGHMEGDLVGAREREKRFKSTQRLAAKRPDDATWVTAADQMLAWPLSERERGFVKDMRKRFARRRTWQPTSRQHIRWAIQVIELALDTISGDIDKYLLEYLEFPRLCNRIFEAIAAKPSRWFSDSKLFLRFGRNQRYGGEIDRALKQLEREGRLIKRNGRDGDRGPFAEGWLALEGVYDE